MIGLLCHHLICFFWLAAMDILDLLVIVEANDPMDRPLIPECILDGILIFSLQMLVI